MGVVLPYNRSQETKADRGVKVAVWGARVGVLLQFCYAALCMAGVFTLLGICLIVARSDAQETRPTVQHQVFAGAQRRGVPLAIDATLSAPAGLKKAEVYCRPSGAGGFTALPMAPLEGDVYRAIIPDWMTSGEGLDYYITVTDQQGVSTSQGFVGFPLHVNFYSPSTREERVKSLDDALDILRRQRQERTVEPSDIGSSPSGGR